MHCPQKVRHYLGVFLCKENMLMFAIKYGFDLVITKLKKI